MKIKFVKEVALEEDEVKMMFIEESYQENMEHLKVKYDLSDIDILEIQQAFGKEYHNYEH